MTIRPVKVRRIDWFRVLCDLKGAGMSLGAHGDDDHAG